MFQLLDYFKTSDPWIENPPCDGVIVSEKPTELSDEDLQDILFKLFLGCRFQPRYDGD